MGVESAIGLEFELNGKKGPIVGVVKDFHFKSFHEKVRPMAMFIFQQCCIDQSKSRRNLTCD